jgi:hypothetical protein
MTFLGLLNKRLLKIINIWLLIDLVENRNFVDLIILNWNKSLIYLITMRNIILLISEIY